jgi:CSLREA domain-containing protein
MKKSSPVTLRWSPIFFILAVMAVVSAEGATWTVNTTTDNGTGTCTASKCTLRDAVLTAVSGDTITFALPANSTITLTNGELSIDSKSLTISGPGAKQLAVRRSSAAGTPQFRIFHISNHSLVSISGLTISNGHPAAPGGAISNEDANLTITGCIISGNAGKGGDGGGGIYNTGTLTVTETTIADNSSQFGGGGVRTNSGDVTIINSTISGNSTDSLGGGISIVAGTLTVSNSTIFGNSVTNGTGGGIFSYNCTVTITSSTISGNSAKGSYSAISGGGGIITSGATVKVKNTIIAKNTGPGAPDIYGPVTSDGYNLIGDKSGAMITATTGDQIGMAGSPIDPMLGPLHDNGGPTKTNALLSGSKAIDKGTSAELDVDQRGFTRPIDTPAITNADDGSDIGAYEVQPDQLTGCSEINLVVKNTSDSDGGSLRSIITSACAGSTITFADSVRGAIVLTSGELLIDKNLIVEGPGANLLAVQRNGGNSSTLFRIFNLNTPGKKVAISGLTIAGGASYSGGGIYSIATLALSNVTIRNNFATAGGGIFNNGAKLNVANSTISDNSVSGLTSGSGGGVFISGGTFFLTGSTVSGNSAIAKNANHDDSGGGIFLNVGSTLISTSTITNNSADFGGGVRAVNGAQVHSRSSIIARNSSPNGPDFNGTVESFGFTMIGNNSMTMMAQSGYDQIGTPTKQVNPLLGLLKNNGGPTATHALQSDSPAIDKGQGADGDFDQRGFPRRSDDPNITNPIPGDGSDIGSYELQIPTPTPTPTPTPKPTPKPTPTPTATPKPSATPTVTPKPRATPTTLGNISTRVRVETGSNVLIGGFIVTGTQPKKVLIRAIGSSLAIAGHLEDPKLELFHGQTLLASNDNWADSPDKQAIIDTTIPPSDSRESALIATLPANNSAYTAIVRGVNNGTGVGLVEVYDLDRAVNSKLANISTRGVVQTADNAMIGGFIVLNGTQKVIVRAIGPSLPVTGALQDPFLELHDKNGAVLQSNDNWKTGGQQAEIIATTVAPTNERESAIVRTLTPGNYTGVVRGVNETTGVALVEVFALK